MCNSNWATHCLDCSRRSMMKDNMGYSSYHHWGCLFINCLIFVMTCLWTFLGKLNIETWLLVAWCVIPYWLKSLHLPSVASLLLCVTEWAGRWLYSSPLEALVVLVITGTDRSVISYKYKLFGYTTKTAILLLCHIVMSRDCLVVMFTITCIFNVCVKSSMDKKYV